MSEEPEPSWAELPRASNEAAVKIKTRDNTVQTLQAISPELAEGKTKTLFDAFAKRVGGIPNMIRIMGNSPVILDLYLEFNEAFAKAKITPKLRGLITVAVSNLNGCTYTLAIAHALGRREGLTEDELSSAAELRSSDPKAAAALAFAASVTRKHGSVSPLEVQNLREAGYSDEEIVEIIALIALNIFRNYFNLIAGTDLDFPEVKTTPIPNK